MAVTFVEKGIVTSTVGKRNGKNHNGTDYAVPVGTSVQSTVNGKIIFTGNDPDGYGNYVKVKDNSGNIHIFAHLSKIETAIGESVTAGQEIAKSGNTGRSTGPHVHYEVRSADNSVLNGANFVTGTGSANAELLGTTSSGDDAGFVAKLCVVIALIFVAGTAIIFLLKTFDIKMNPKDMVIDKAMKKIGGKKN